MVQRLFTDGASTVDAIMHAPGEVYIRFRWESHETTMPLAQAAEMAGCVLGFVAGLQAALQKHGL
jgi:hypothetical protein